METGGSTRGRNQTKNMTARATKRANDKAEDKRCAKRNVEMKMRAVLEEIVNLQPDLNERTAFAHVTASYRKYLERELRKLPV